MRIMRAEKFTNYASIILVAFEDQLCSKLCWHKIRTPSYLSVVKRLGSGCVGSIGPVKDSLTYHPSSQGWAPRVMPLIICLVCGVVDFVCFVWDVLVGFLVS